MQPNSEKTGEVTESGASPLARPGSDHSTVPKSEVGFEEHTKRNPYVRDAIIGLADGLTVPFALTAGLSSIGSSKLVILGGLAELFAGSISMGLGAYLAGVTEKRHYRVELSRENRQVLRHPEHEVGIMADMFSKYGIDSDDLRPIVKKLRRDPAAWVNFMMHFELMLEDAGSSAPWLSALVMGLAYLFGGLIPMIPYFAIRSVDKALFVSIGITAVMLMVFGYVKAIVTGIDRRAAFVGAAETLLIGAIAAAVSYGIVKGVDEGFDLKS